MEIFFWPNLDDVLMLDRSIAVALLGGKGRGYVPQPPPVGGQIDLDRKK